MSLPTPLDWSIPVEMACVDQKAYPNKDLTADPPAIKPCSAPGVDGRFGIELGLSVAGLHHLGHWPRI